MSDRFNSALEEARALLGVSTAIDSVQLKRLLIEISLKNVPDRAGTSEELRMLPENAPSHDATDPILETGESTRLDTSSTLQPSKQTFVFQHQKDYGLDYSSSYPLPRVEVPLPREGIAQTRARLALLKRQYLEISKLLVERFKESLVTGSEEYRSAMIFARVWKLVGTALVSAIAWSNRLMPGNFGQDMLEKMDVFAEDNEKFLAVTRLILQEVTVSQSTEVLGSGETSLGLGLLMGLAVTPISPVYYVPSSVHGWYGGNSIRTVTTLFKARPGG